MWEECTTKCSSRKHADSIFSVFIAAGDEFEDMVMKLLPTCCNIASNKDSSGRTALQVAASLGKMKILHWLFSHDVYVNAKDEESGYSALHRTFYYGQLQAARALLHNNAGLFHPLDNDYMSPFDHLIQDRSDLNKLDANLPSQVHVWGSNSNFGLGKQQSPELPELLDVFPKGSGGIKKVVMNKFHSVFLTLSGQAFSCGIGQGGKLGLGSEATVIIPQKISIDAENSSNSKVKKSAVILEAVLGTYHTILLTEGGNVLSFGSNMYHQLGHNPPPNQLVAPKVITRFEDKSKGVIIKGISASRFHSVFWCQRNVYTCGLNAGALGHIKGDKTIITPKRVPLLSEENYTITHVAASDGATAIATEGGNVFVLHEFQCRKIASKQYDLLKIVMEGGKLDFSQEDLAADTSVPFQVLLLTKSGKIYIWSQTHPVLTKCAFRGSPFCIIKDVSLCKNAIVLVNIEGGAFVGTIGKTFVSKRKTAHCATQENVPRIELPKQEHLVRIQIQRIPGVYRATSIVCDPAGKNFAVIQVLPSAEKKDAQICIPPSQLQTDLKQLLQDADPYDLTHDIVFLVGSKTFAAHRFVLSASCNAFYQNVCASSLSFKNDNKTVHITDVPAEVFELILEFIYTGTCAIFETEAARWNLKLPLEEPLDKDNYAEDLPSAVELKRVKGEEWKSNERDGLSRVLRMVQFHAKNVGLRKLAEILDKAHIANTGLIRNDRLYLQPKQWNRFSGDDFYDTKIVSNDGKEFDAHRAVLIARSDYFRSMFSYAWIESVVSKKIPLPIHSLVLEVILDYFYEDKASKVEKSEDVEWISNCLVSADLLLIPRLVSICESALVGLLSIKNVGKVLDFAAEYNATQLKISCMHFVCCNLPAVIELRVWNCLSEEVMKELTHFYQQFIPRISRLPTPSKHLTSDDLDIFTITESLEDVNLTSVNRERDVKRKKTRRKSGKKGSEFKHPHQLQSEPCSPLTSDVNPNIENTVCLKKEVWSKVDKPKKRNKSLSFETPAKELNPSSSPSKTQIQDNNKVFLGVRSKETDSNISASSPVNEHDETPAKQNSLTLFEVATIFQATNSPENEKCKKFRKLSQKQRKFKENNAVIATPNTSSLAWKTTFSEPQCADQITVPLDPMDQSIICRDDPINSPSKSKVHSVWGSPDKTKDTSKAQKSESEEKFVPLQHIIAKERIERKNFIKISTKPLKLTLIEEKAIEDLTKFYGIDHIDDEFILVERVLPLAAAVPIWSGGKVSPLKSKNKLRSFSMSDSGI